MEYFKRLEHVREVRGLRSVRKVQQRLKSQLGYEVSYPSVRAYHVGEREPPAEYFVRFAELTGARLEWLLTGREPIFERDEDSLTAILDRASEQGTGMPLEERLRAYHRGFWSNLPEVDVYSHVVRALLYELLRRWHAGGASQPEQLGGELERLGSEVGRLLRVPYVVLGFSKHPSSREFTDYAVSVLQALLLLAPGEGPEVAAPTGG
jgi:hypothetical protein